MWQNNVFIIVCFSRFPLIWDLSPKSSPLDMAEDQQQQQQQFPSCILMYKAPIYPAHGSAWRLWGLPPWGSSSWWRSEGSWASAAGCPGAGRPLLWPAPSGTSCTAAWWLTAGRGCSPDAVEGGDRQSFIFHVGWFNCFLFPCILSPMVFTSFKAQADSECLCDVNSYSTLSFRSFSSRFCT